MNIGLVKETKIGERRVALIPEDVQKLVQAGHQVSVADNCGKEAGFSNEDYQKVGAKVVSSDEVYSKKMIIRVKEPPIDTIRRDQIIMGYLHVEKNQNPALLNTLIANNVTAYAFEEIRNEIGHRIVSLGFEAGIVGMFEGLRVYGKMLEEQGYENIFKDVKPISEYPAKKEAYFPLREIDPRKFDNVVAVAGYGKVSKGAQEVLAQLSHPPLILREEDTLRTKFYNQDYAYVWKHLPMIDVFVNAIVWKPGQQRVLTTEDLEKMKNHTLIIDISCDASGGVQTCRPTTWENPTYTVQTSTGKTVTHFCVDNLPSAMAYDSSYALSKMVVEHVLKVANGEELSSGMMTKDGMFVFK